jgi:F-type H+-transporting ATPase subunit delta
MATISNNDIADTIYSLSKGKSKDQLPDIFKKVVIFLNHRNLLTRAPDILEKLDKIINKNEERIVVKVMSSKKLSDKAKKDLSIFLEKRYKIKEVLLIEKLNEKLLGGVRVEINDEVIDLTIKNKIEKLQEYLIKKHE